MSNYLQHNYLQLAEGPTTNTTLSNPYLNGTSNVCDYTYVYTYPIYTNYPIYIDKTEKAIKIVRNLLPKISDLDKFLEAVEKVKKEL